MDRQAHEYAAAMAFAQQQQQQANMQQQQQQQFGFHPQPQQFPPQMHGGQFLPHPSLQQFPPYHPQMPPQQQLYAHHQQAFPHLQQQQQLSHSFPPHPPPHHLSPPYIPPLDPAPPPAAPPSDPELQKRIDKLVEYSAKNGPEFEAMIREKQQDNPDYNFLFGGEGYSYYRYKLWLSTRPSGVGFNQSFRQSSMPMMPPSHSPMLNPSAIHPPLMGGTSPGLMLGESQMHQPSYPPFYDQHQQPPQPYMEQGRAHYDLSTKPFKGLSGPLPSDVAAELNNVLINLNGTKESIKGAKIWFMQRSPFAPALAEALRDRIYNIDDSEKQLHIIFLANDILFDSLQRRANLQELDNEALAFKPVLGSMLGRVYNNPHNKDSNQSRLEKILQFWASKEVYDQETIANLEKEMTGGLPLRSAMDKDARASSDPSGLPQQWRDKHISSGLLDQQEADKHLPPNAPSQFAPGQFMANQLPSGIYPPVAQPPFSTPLSALPTVMTTGQPLIPNLQSIAAPTATDQTPPPYPLFPPGLIPGMVRKMQIGSGVPYSPLSPLDIPTVIPPSTVPQSEILERVSKFFKEIGETNPSEGPMRPSDSNDEDSEYEQEEPVRKGGACIPPPPNLQVDPETGTYADGGVDRKPGSSGSGRLGLGATADPNEISQYDDVYTSYRKQRSTNYHTSMSARATAR